VVSCEFLVSSMENHWGHGIATFWVESNRCRSRTTPIFGT
jgi:hypothetical protein